jgi:uncharacterized protein YndB with AHSA1/START domain
VALNDIHIDAPPERVFAVLADWRAYGHWVVGAKRIRGVDPGFPARGTRFFPVVGIGPLELPAETEVLEVEPGRRLVLHAKASPLGTAINEIVLEPDGTGGTTVHFREDPGDRLSAFLFTPLTHLLVRGRNEESLRRLKSLAEDRADVGRDVDLAPSETTG